MQKLMLKILTLLFVVLSTLVFPLYAGPVPGNNRSVYLSLPIEELWQDSLSLAQRYLDFLKVADDSAFKVDFEAEFLLILNKKEKDYYLTLPGLADKKQFIAQYWRAYNPNPLLPQNDRLLDHVRRCAFARKHFPAPAPPYIDDRGIYYIKYGKPTIRYVDPGGFRRISLFSPGIYEQIEQFYTIGTAPPQNYSVPANESWGYENVSPNFVVHFVWKGQTYKRVKSLSEILRSRKRSNMAWQWSDLIKKRASISPALSEAAANIESFEVELMHVAFSGNDGFRGEKFSTGSAHDKMIRRLEDSDREIQKSMIHVPPASYDPIFAVNQLRLTDRVSQFRGLNGKTRVEINVFSPFKMNLAPKFDKEARDTLELEFSSMLRSRFFTPLDSTRQSSTWPLAAAIQESLHYAVNQLALEAKPQRAELTLQIRDLKNKKLGFAKSILNIRNFSSHKNLMLSDLQFYVESPKDARPNLLPVKIINNLRLVPAPFDRVKKSQMLFCYFEIYNLQSSGIRHQYEIAYTVSSQREGRSIFHKISRLVSHPRDISISMKQAQPLQQDSSQELIGLDLHALSPGTYNLEIIVADPQNRDLAARTTQKLVVVD